MIKSMTETCLLIRFVSPVVHLAIGYSTSTVDEVKSMPTDIVVLSVCRGWGTDVYLIWCRSELHSKCIGTINIVVIELKLWMNGIKHGVTLTGWWWWWGRGGSSYSLAPRLPLIILSAKSAHWSMRADLLNTNTRLSTGHGCLCFTTIIIWLLIVSNLWHVWCWYWC